MKKSVAKRQETTKADAYLKGQGFSDDDLSRLTAPARRIFATGLERELTELGTLSPGERRAAEADIMQTARMVFEQEEWGYPPASGKSLAESLAVIGCKTHAGRRALEGLHLMLSGNSLSE